MSVKRDVIDVRSKYESLLELARQAAARPRSNVRDLLLRDASETLKVVTVMLRKADDARRWAHEVLGHESDNSPLTLYLSNAMARALNATMGQQIYRLQNFLKGRAVGKTPHPAGMLAAAALAEVTR
jgi:hypothetical protein